MRMQQGNKKSENRLKNTAPTGKDERQKSEGKIWQIVPAAPLAALDYETPQDSAEAAPMALAEGDWVEVPLQGRLVAGLVWKAVDRPAMDGIKTRPLKKIIRRFDLPPAPLELRRFMAFMAAYTMTPLGLVLRMALGGAKGLEAPAPVAWLRATDTQRQAENHTPAAKGKKTPKRAKILAYCQESGPMPMKQIQQDMGVSRAFLQSMVRAGFLEIFEGADVKNKPVKPAPHRFSDLSAAPILRSEQADAARALLEALGRFRPFLLEGVTGSGKTEVYFELIAALLAQPEGQILVLLPEIALTNQWLDRFELRFGVKPLVWHSGLTPAQRRRAWRQIVMGQARLVVGARSALFLPFACLTGLIIDEEHDQSFKQEEGVLYHARDMAVVRAREAGCPIILASATPSLESRVNAEQGRYQHLRLIERHGLAILPHIHTVDMRLQPPPSGHWISPPLIDAVRETVAKGEQALLFLNRRGYAPLLLCRTCGHRLECPHCAAWLVEHRFKGQLQCHHCGFEKAMPALAVFACPQCKDLDSYVPCGPGVERLYEEASKLFPQARLGVMTSDTMQKPSEMAKMINDFASGQIDLVIGTQMITKGYHFPNLTLVGVIDADMGLRGGDLRAGERSYQQLVQVAGRAGREDREGHVFLQTYEPNHPAVEALVKGDGDAFMAMESAARARHHMPPFGRLAALLLTGPALDPLLAYGRKLLRHAPSMRGLEIWGPAPAPLVRLRGHYRVRLLIRADREVRLQALLHDWLTKTGRLKEGRCRIDIDPYNFM